MYSNSNQQQKFPELTNSNNNNNQTIANKQNQEEKLKLPSIEQKSQNSDNTENRKPIKFDEKNNSFDFNNSLERRQLRENLIRPKKSQTSLSQDSTSSKKIVKWHLWWEKPQSELRVPSYALPPKDVPSRIGSLENLNHRPGGGNVRLVNDKLKWTRAARIDHLAKNYRPGGGNRQILNEKLKWNTSSKIGSLENINHSPGGGRIQIINQPFNKHGVRPRIDSGFIYEEMYVPSDYQISPSPRHTLEPIHEMVNRPRIKN